MLHSWSNLDLPGWRGLGDVGIAYVKNLLPTSKVLGEVLAVVDMGCRSVRSM